MQSSETSRCRFAVNPILSPVAVQGSGGVARDLVLQPGTVIDAKVLKVLANNMVRIAIANLSLDVMSQVPLQAGQALQLAVSQSEGGIRLAVVGQGAGAAGDIADTVTLAPGAQADALANPPATSAPPKNISDAAREAGGFHGGADRRHPAGQSGAAVCKCR